MSQFQSQKVHLVRHGSADFPYKETHDAYLITADTVALCDFNAWGGGRFAFYDTGGLTQKNDGYHLYDDAHPESFSFEFAKATATKEARLPRNSRYECRAVHADVFHGRRKPCIKWAKLFVIGERGRAVLRGSHRK